MDGGGDLRVDGINGGPLHALSGVCVLDPMKTEGKKDLKR